MTPTLIRLNLPALTSIHRQKEMALQGHKTNVKGLLIEAADQLRDIDRLKKAFKLETGSLPTYYPAPINNPFFNWEGKVDVVKLSEASLADLNAALLDVNHYFDRVQDWMNDAYAQGCTREHDRPSLPPLPATEVTCPKCGNNMEMHHPCSECGHRIPAEEHEAYFQASLIEEGDDPFDIDEDGLPEF